MAVGSSRSTAECRGLRRQRCAVRRVRSVHRKPTSQDPQPRARRRLLRPAVMVLLAGRSGLLLRGGPDRPLADQPAVWVFGDVCCSALGFVAGAGWWIVTAHRAAADQADQSAVCRAHHRAQPADAQERAGQLPAVSLRPGRRSSAGCSKRSKNKRPRTWLACRSSRPSIARD